MKLEKPDDYYFYRGVSLAKANNLKGALSAYEAYVKASGREGEHYDDALSAITQIEERLVSAQASKAAPMPTNLLGDTKPGEQFDAKVRSLYPHDDTRDALIEYINALLMDHIYMEGAVKNRATSKQIRYKMAWSQSGDLVVNKTVVDPTSSKSVTEVDRVAVYGLNPKVRSTCLSYMCWLKHPGDGSDWIKIGADNERSVKALTMGIERLIVHMQRY